MATQKLIPALADVTQDIAGPLPLELLYGWAGGPRDPATAARLLAPYRVAGAVVATDSSGLTEMAEERDALEVMALISRPKEVLAGLGRAAGGRPIGVWVADNTEMIFPEPVDAAGLVDMLLEAQVRIAAAGPVRVGMCAHRGAFFELGGGLSGAAAATVEYLAEEHAGPGEILVTPELGLAAGGHVLRERPELRAHHPGGVCAVTSARRRPDLVAAAGGYPIPFPRAFYERLQRADHERGEEERIRLEAEYLRPLAVLFVARERAPGGDGEDALLDELLANVLLDGLVRQAPLGGGAIYRSTGGWAMLGFPEPAEAVAAAAALRERGRARGVTLRAGIDYGPVLVYDGSEGFRGLDGGPVNCASKLCEDAGRPGAIQVAARAVAHLGPQPPGEPFEVVVSRVRLAGRRL
ncbi:MAG TPA: hypothetical protein VGQ83_33075 [Polyangia bacterium]|jgi:class 3 adenylate cyclase